jgi:hypothetical protein
LNAQQRHKLNNNLQQQLVLESHIFELLLLHLFNSVIAKEVWA